MTPDSELERLFPAKPIDPKETAEDRWEFNQQSEALYQARINKPIDPPFHADSLPTTKANDSHSEPVLPLVNEMYGDEE